MINNLRDNTFEEFLACTQHHYYSQVVTVTCGDCKLRITLDKLRQYVNDHDLLLEFYSKFIDTIVE